MRPYLVLSIAWAVWIVSWLAAAFWSDRAAQRPAFRDEWLYRIVTVVGIILLVVRFRHLSIGGRLWSPSYGIDWALVAIAVLGFAFTWWARLYLGRLWSSSVTRKADHHVVDTGPYAIVRHPIYTGILAAIFATAALKGTLPGIAGALLLTLAFWIKARLEERFLREQLGPDAYESYRRRVPMLLPFGRKSG